MDNLNAKDFFEEHVAAYVEGLLDQRKSAIMDAIRRSNPELDELAIMHEQILTMLNSTEEVQAPVHLRENILAAVRTETADMLALETAVKRKAFLISSSFFAVSLALLAALFKGTFNAVVNSGSNATEDAVSYVYSEIGKFVGGLLSNQQWMANIQIFLDSVSRSVYVSGAATVLTVMFILTVLAVSGATYFIFCRNMQCVNTSI